MSFAFRFGLNWHCTSAYVTYEDICQIGVFQDQTIVSIRAPEETKLEVPTPTEVRHKVGSYEILDNCDIIRFFILAICELMFVYLCYGLELNPDSLEGLPGPHSYTYLWDWGTTWCSGSSKQRIKAFETRMLYNTRREPDTHKTTYIR